MKKDEKEIINELRDSIIKEIRYLNTSGLEIILFTIYNLKNYHSEYKESDE